MSTYPNFNGHVVLDVRVLVAVDAARDAVSADDLADLFKLALASPSDATLVGVVSATPFEV